MSYNASFEWRREAIRAKHTPTKETPTATDSTAPATVSFSKCWMCDYVCTSPGYAGMPSVLVQRHRSKPAIATGLTLCSVCTSACSRPPGTAIIDVINAGHSTNCCRTRSHSYVAFLREYKLVGEVLALEITEATGKDKIEGLLELGEKWAVIAVQRLMTCVDDTLSDGHSLKATERGVLLAELARLQGLLQIAARRQALRAIELDRRRVTAKTQPAGPPSPLSPRRSAAAAGKGGAQRASSSVDITSPARRHQPSKYYNSVDLHGGAANTSAISRASSDDSRGSTVNRAVAALPAADRSSGAFSPDRLLKVTREIEDLARRPLLDTEALLPPVPQPTGPGAGDLLDEVLLAFFEGRIEELPLLAVPQSSSEGGVSNTAQPPPPLLPSQRVLELLRTSSVAATSGAASASVTDDSCEGLTSGEQYQRQGGGGTRGDPRGDGRRGESPASSTQLPATGPSVRGPSAGQAAAAEVALHVASASREFREFEVEHFRQVEEWRREREGLELRLEKEQHQRRQLADMLARNQRETSSLLAVNEELTTRLLSMKMEETLAMHLRHMHSFMKLATDRCAELALTKASLFANQAAAVVAVVSSATSGGASLGSKRSGTTNSSGSLRGPTSIV
jgi:hypothetical protein